MKNLLAACTLFLCFGITAQTIYVNPQASGANDGTSWANAYTDLQVAINNAPSGASLWLRSATYYPIRDTTGSANSDPRNNMFYILRKTLYIYGGFIGNETILAQRNPNLNPTTISGENGTTPNDSTDNIRMLFYIETDANSSVTFDGLRFTKAFNSDGNSFITSTNYQGAITFAGKGNGGLLLFNCKLFDNYGNLRGGALSGGGGYIIINTCEFYNNYAYENGGAIYFSSGNSFGSTFINSYFHENKVSTNDGYGGAVKLFYKANEPHQFRNCVFYKNEARFGGAVQLWDLDADFHNCTFYDNYIPPSTPGFITGGASIYTYQVGKVNVYNSILHALRPSIRDFSAAEVVKVHNSIVRGGYGNGTNIFNYDPYFVDVSKGNFAPAFCSPVIDAGNKDSLPANLLIDMRTNARVYNGQVDLGAIEFQGFNKTLMVDSTNPTLKNIIYMGTTEGVSYRWLRCDNNYAEVPNATGATLAVTESGVYALEVKQGFHVASSNQCIDTLDCISIQYASVGIDEVAAFKTMLYPNPTTSDLIVEASEMLDEIKIVDVTGRVLFSSGSNLQNQQLKIDVSKFAPATYFVYLKTNNGTIATRNFVKQ